MQWWTMNNSTGSSKAATVGSTAVVIVLQAVWKQHTQIHQSRTCRLKFKCARDKQNLTHCTYQLLTMSYMQWSVFRVILSVGTYTGKVQTLVSFSFVAKRFSYAPEPFLNVTIFFVLQSKQNPRVNELSEGYVITNNRDSTTYYYCTYNLMN